MPHKHSAHKKEKSDSPFSTIFFHSATKEQLEKKILPKTVNHKKQIWLWLSVGAVMLILILAWAISLPERMKLTSTNDIAAQLFKENKDKLSELFNQNKETINFISATPSLYDTVLKAVTSSTSASAASSTLGLTPEQLEKLKNKIDKK